MKKIFLLVLPLISLIGCFDEPEGTPIPDRSLFIGNYDLTLNCNGSLGNSTHLVFIEAPIGKADSISTAVVFRNLLNNNATTNAIVSQYDIILNDRNILGTGTISEDGKTLSLSIYVTDNACEGTGARRL